MQASRCNLQLSNQESGFSFPSNSWLAPPSVECRKCALFYGKLDFTVDKKFVDGEVTVINGVGCPSNKLCSEFSAIKMCQHSSCFKTETKSSPEKNHVKRRVRIAGQGQLNRNNDCQYFKPAFWRFWQWFR